MNFSSFLRPLRRAATAAILGAFLAPVCSAITFPPTATVPTHALRFLGTSQFVAVPHTAGFNVTTQFTVEAWIQVSAFDKNDMAFVTKGDDLAIVRNGNTSRLSFRTRSGTSTDDLISTATLVTGRWYHVAVVYNGSTKLLYLDGALDASKAYTSPVNVNTLALNFGANAALTGRNLNGRLDTVRFWSVARSLTEVRADLGRDLHGDDPGLLGEWRFDESSGTVAEDSSSANRDGTLVNMVAADRVLGLDFRPPPPRSTVPGGALRFDTNDRQFVSVDGRYEPDFDLTGTSITLEAWVKVAAFDQPWQAIVTKGESWGLTRSNATSKVVFRTRNGAVIHDLGSTDDLLLGRWYHVAGVCDGTQKRLYIDGVLNTQVAYSAALVANNVPVVIGGNLEIPNRDFNGDIESVRVWSVARSAADIDNNKLRLLRGSEAGLLGDWGFNEGAGSQALDGSFAERHATSVNMIDERNRVAGLAFAAAPPANSSGSTGALRLTGSAGLLEPRVVIPSEAQFDVTAGLTIEAWIFVEAFDRPWQAIVTKGDGWGLTRYQETSQLAFRTQRGLEYLDLVGNTSLELNRWYHVAAVFDGAQKLLYLDGVLDASSASTEPIEVNDFPVVIGANAKQPNRAFRGRIDSVRLWSSLRTAEEIAANFDRDLRGSEAGLLGDWRFNEASGTAAVDNSPRRLDGTLTDMVLPADRVGGLPLRDPADGELAIALDQSSPIKQFIQFPDEAKFDFPTPFTVETWVYFEELPSATVALVSKGSSAWQLILRPSGKVQFSTFGLNDAIAVPPTDLVSASALPAKEWIHLAATWNPLTRTKSIYINGVRDESHSGISGTLGQNNLSVLLGADPLPGGLAGSHFSGVLDEVRLWTSERSEERIRDNVTRRLTGLEPQLAGVWNMNEGSGNLVLDGRLNASLSHGSLSAGMTALNRVDGQPLGDAAAAQYALTFNGIDDYVEVADQASLTLSGKATFEAWVRPTGTGWRTILSKGAAGYGLAMDDQNRLRFHINGTREDALMSQSRLQNDVWQHVAVVVNNAPAGTTLYIDGRPAGQSSSATISNQTGPLWIGRRSAVAPTDPFAGQIDEVRIWNTARTSQEVEFFAFSSPSPMSNGLTAYWAFNEGRGTALADLGPGRLNGVLTSMDDSHWRDGQLWPSPPVDTTLNLQSDTSSKGLWIGNITLTQVNEVQKALNGVSNTETPTADAASIRVLLHVDAAGRARLLKDVVIMQTYTIPNDTTSVKRVVLVTDPTRIHQFQGVVARGGKLVGIRHGSVAFDFPRNELALVGGVGKGVACAGTIQLDPQAATNPFRHRYHPDHRSGYAIGRQFSFKFDGASTDPLTEGPNYGVQRLTGTYQETVTGLHKIALRVAGVVTLDRVSSVDVLNDGKF
jgi:hypothetical protein